MRQIKTGETAHHCMYGAPCTVRIGAIGFPLEQEAELTVDLERQGRVYSFYVVRFRVLFRERGILSFFHAGKMTTYRAKIPRFRCGYFRL